jgi:hypothetical protein
MATARRIGFPSVGPPNAAMTERNLRAWQQQIDNIRERFEAIESAYTTSQALTTARAATTATSLSAMQRELRDLLRRVNSALALAEQLLELFSLAESFEDGDIWVYRDSVAQFVPEPGGEIGGGGVLPMVTGEILDGQPVFMYFDDGSLMYAPVPAEE